LFGLVVGEGFCPILVVHANKAGYIAEFIFETPLLWNTRSEYHVEGPMVGMLTSSMNGPVEWISKLIMFVKTEEKLIVFVTLYLGFLAFISFIKLLVVTFRARMVLYRLMVLISISTNVNIGDILDKVWIDQRLAVIGTSGSKSNHEVVFA
jgi:hypothetical protein